MRLPIHVQIIVKKRNDHVRCTAIGPEEDGTWRGCINLHDERGRFLSRVYLSEPEHPTKDHAIRAMKYQVNHACREAA